MPVAGRLGDMAEDGGEVVGDERVVVFGDRQVGTMLIDDGFHDGVAACGGSADPPMPRRETTQRVSSGCLHPHRRAGLPDQSS